MKSIQEIKYNKDNSEVDERLIELASLLEILKLLSASLNLPSVLNNILLTPMGRMMISKGVIMLERSLHEFTVESIKGLPKEWRGKTMYIDSFPDQPFYIADLVEKCPDLMNTFLEAGLMIGFPINSNEKMIGVILFGNKLSKQDFSTKEIDFLSSLSNISATAIQNSLMFTEIQDVNRRLDHSNQELNTLFDIGGELNSTLDSDQIIKVLGFAIMGQLLVNKYAVYLWDEEDFLLMGVKGFKDLPVRCSNENAVFLSGLNEPFLPDKGGNRNLSGWLFNSDVKLLIPMQIKDETKGFLLIGEKINKVAYSSDNMGFLITLANQSMISLENARLFEETLEKQRLEEELAVAREIQAQLLPNKELSLKEFDIKAINISSKFVGGDYYDVIDIGEDNVGVVIADVSGKGIPASLLMANVQASFRALAEVIESPAEMTRRINTIIYKNTTADKFITYFFSNLNRKTCEIKYCNAGHNPPFIMDKDGGMKFLDQGGLILGMLPDVEYLEGDAILNKDEVFVMYTDGISEALNPESEEFEEHRLYEVVKNNRGGSATEISAAILGAVKEFTEGEPQSDDITLVVIKCS